MRSIRYLSLFAALAWLQACSPVDSSDQSRLKIIGGTPVSPDNPIANHVAALVDANGSVKCTVAAVAPNLFVTAAHCVHARSIEGWTIQTGLTAGQGEILPIESAVTDANFAPGMLYSVTPQSAPNDVALIRTLEPSMAAIPLPIIRKGRLLELGEHTPITIAGYGRTDGDDANSKGELQSVDLEITSFNPQVHEFTSENPDGKMGCHGDSGGPVFYSDGESLVLIGAVSRGDTACVKGLTVMTDLSAFNQLAQYIQTKSVK